MADVVDDILKFNELVSDFQGDKALQQINNYLENPRGDKSLRYLFNKSYPIRESKCGRGKSYRDFSKRLKFNDLGRLLSGVYDIPKSGGIDAIHGYVLCECSDFEGLVYTDFSDYSIIEEGYVSEIKRKIYGETDVDFAGASFSLFLTGEIDKLSSKYNHLSYDYFMLMGGMIAQNLYLRSTQLDIKKIALGCYSKREVSKIFDTDDLVITNLIFGK